MVLIELLPIFFVCLIAAIVVNSISYLVSRRLNKYSIVDVSWGPTFIVIGFVALLYNSTYTPAMLVALTLVSLWGARLASHIYQRFKRSKTDDRRYVELVDSWHVARPAFHVYTRIFLVQALLACLVMLPVLTIAASGHSGVLLLTIAGGLVWLGGFCFEAIGDRQLAGFIRTNPGQLMRTGLWKYTRHPNYFGEIVQWIGIALIALGVPGGWIGLAGPALIGYLIIAVSGIPPAEKNMQNKTDWQDYAARTSVLIPWKPKL